jgi:tRNA(Ile)-lysidine synthase
VSEIDPTDPKVRFFSRRVLAGRHALAAALDSGLRRDCDVEGGGLVLAVSGGADSLSLLWLGAAIADRARDDRPWRPLVAHIDHGLRHGSMHEARFVEQQANAAGLECEVVRVDCRGPGNVSDRARRARYEALEQIARRRGCAAIVTAHHAEDRLESILIGLGRGRGLESLRSMPARRSLGDGLVLVRPLLRVSKASLSAFVDQLGLEPIVDPSNFDPRRLRARLRKVVVPELDAIVPGAASHAGSLSEEAELAAEAIERWLADTFGPPETCSWPRGELAILPVQLRVAGLHRSLRTLEPAAARDVPRRVVEAVSVAIGDADRRPRRWAFGASLDAEVTSNLVRVRRRGDGDQDPADCHGPRHAAT